MTDANENELFSNDIKKVLAEGDNNAVLALLKERDVKVPIESGKKTLLHLAAAYGNAVIVEYLIKRGCVVDAQDDDEITPLMLAAFFRHVEVMRVLIDAGAGLCNVNSKSRSPIFYIKNADDPEVKTILTIAIESEKVCKDLAIKSFRDAAYNDMLFSHFFNTLLRHKPQPNFDEKFNELLLIKGILSNSNKYTALHDAATIDPKFFSEVASTLPMFLYYVGANVNAKNDKGETPLHVAVRNSNNEAVSWLLDRGADVNARNHNGQTPLHLAFSRQSKTVELLLRKGADLHAISSTGETILQLAKKVGKGPFILRQLMQLEVQGKPLNTRDLKLVKDTASMRNLYERTKLKLAK